jgi:hypothetical protein
LESPRIAVITTDWLRDERLFEALGELYQVSFVPARDLRSVACDAVILMRASRSDAMEAGRNGVRCLAFVTREASPSFTRSAPVELSSAPYLSPAFRGAALFDESIEVFCGPQLHGDDEVLAHRGADLLWTRHLKGKAAVDVVRVAPPVLNKSEYLYSRFAKDRWFSLLPLLHFVKEFSGWTVPPVRACFMLDDPNLHWPSYGYVKYEEITRDAEVHNYHVAFATVPMDGWFVHSLTSQLFRDCKSRVSLLVHGNNHTYRELAQASTPTKRVALAAQAFRRTERIERASGVQVARIMAAPHGACTEPMAQALLSTGFLAACISRGSLMVHNPDVVWPLCVGLTPAEFLGGGLPVIPRLPIQVPPHTLVRMAAFLGQPVILVGHHDDLAYGLGLFHDRAQLINSLEDVRWENMLAIARTNYWWRQCGGLLQIRMYSRSVQVTLPSSVTQILVDRPWLGQNGRETLIIDGTSLHPLAYNPHRETLISVSPNASTVTIRSVSDYAMDPYTIRLPSMKPTAILRRHFCEVRDRLRPALDTILRPATKYTRT